MSDLPDNVHVEIDGFGCFTAILALVFLVFIFAAVWKSVAVCP
jgi:hypothetical protein